MWWTVRQGLKEVVVEADTAEQAIALTAFVWGETDPEGIPRPKEPTTAEPYIPQRASMDD